MKDTRITVWIRTSMTHSQVYTNPTTGAKYIDPKVGPARTPNSNEMRAAGNAGSGISPKPF